MVWWYYDELLYISSSVEMKNWSIDLSRTLINGLTGLYRSIGLRHWLINKNPVNLYQFSLLSTEDGPRNECDAVYASPFRPVARINLGLGCSTPKKSGPFWTSPPINPLQTKQTSKQINKQHKTKTKAYFWPILWLNVKLLADLGGASHPTPPGYRAWVPSLIPYFMPTVSSSGCTQHWCLCIFSPFYAYSFSLLYDMNFVYSPTLTSETACFNSNPLQDVCIYPYNTQSSSSWVNWYPVIGDEGTWQSKALVCCS